VRDYRETRRALGLVPQEINFDPFFTVEESLRFQAGYFGRRLSEARLSELLSALGLTEKRRANTRGLSGGMKRRLLIGKALVHEPRVLFLDEPTAGVDVELRRALWAYVRRLRAQGTTIVLTTHYIEEAEAHADRVGVLDRGRLILVEEKAALLSRHPGQTLEEVFVGLIGRDRVQALDVEPGAERGAGRGPERDAGQAEDRA
jgi:ABC-2 type transport system ATP-binding protein